MSGPHLLVFGLGYTARTFVTRAGFARVTATTRGGATAAPGTAVPGVTLRRLGPDGFDPHLAADIAQADAILVSAPPDETGDPVLRVLGPALREARAGWIAYLSTIGVYGDHAGAWIDEDTALSPTHARTRRRVAAEEGWRALGAQVFRLSGIYGPGRNAFVKLREGRSQRIVKTGQVFNRIHVADIAATLRASLTRPDPGAVYNVTDDEPAPPQDVTAHAAALAGLPLPPEVDFATAALSSMARSFYGENKRVRNARIKDRLGVRLAYPTYREGLAALVGDAAE